MNHGAIETAYKGYLFRSRLEARWAVFFDAVGIEWKYETQGFEVDGHKYLPDFYLPTSETWCEVKGDPDGVAKDFERMVAMLGPRSPLPGFIQSARRPNCHGLVLLGEVPDLDRGIVMHPILRRSEGMGLTRAWCGFRPPRKDGACVFLAELDADFLMLLGLGMHFQLEKSSSDPGWLVETRIVVGKGEFRGVREAYAAARRARFEHGAHGT